MLIIDVANVLHTTGVLPPDLAGPDLTRLIDMLLASRYRRREMVLVCDGVMPRRKLPAGLLEQARRSERVSVLYSGPDAEADDVIEHLVAKTARTKQPVVVSSDRRVATAAGRRFFATISSETFLGHLAADLRGRNTRAASRPKVESPRHAVPLPAEMVRAWAKGLGVADWVPGAAEVAQLELLASKLAARAQAQPSGRTQNKLAAAKPLKAVRAAKSTQPAGESVDHIDKKGRASRNLTDEALIGLIKDFSGRGDLDDAAMASWLQSVLKHEPGTKHRE